ncbi:hypothetical protein PH5382_03179 [Phaeobacter sp. CECT 5382]|uniref:hypothetical protein n=1 Tax=Rhodobacterales TaxID=204455 RepID=UPI0006DACE2A|nr:hypothetical protein [Phaeobacter sp. CECT 5382]CUH89233.1 hypothetical protein PH5382_03179 [Phaeobacter sp. CECT 5382]
MTKKSINWKPDLSYPSGKGATEQHFSAAANGDALEIDTHPWGDADLMVNGERIAHVEGQKSAGDAFREIEAVAEDIEAQKSQSDEADSKS